MDIKSRNQLAILLLVFAKVLGIAGIILGATNHRLLGGLLLACDGVLLVAAVVIGLRGMSKQSVDEKEQKQLLEQMIREGTLDQYLRDLKASSADKADDGGSEQRLLLADTRR